MQSLLHFFGEAFVVQQGLHEKKGRGVRDEGRGKKKEIRGGGRSLFGEEGDA